MRKKEYDAEKTDKVAIGLIVLNLIVVLVFIFCFPKQYKLYGFDRQLAIETASVAMLLVIVGGFAFWLCQRSIKISRYIKSMINSGAQYTGWIVKVEEYEVYFRGKPYKYTYGVIVDCDIDGKNYQLRSKPLCINPLKKFAGGKCSVYVRDNAYVITDFDYKNKDTEMTLNVPYTTIDVDEHLTVNYVDDFKNFRLK